MFTTHLIIIDTLSPSSPYFSSKLRAPSLCSYFILHCAARVCSTHIQREDQAAAAAPMAAMNSSVLACSYALAGSSPSETANWKLVSMQPAASGAKQLSPCVRAQQGKAQRKEGENQGRRAAMLCLAAALFTTAAASSSSANADVIEDYLEKSKANKELNDKKRLATSGANFARAYTVQFGTCKFPENFTGCQDLAKKGKVKFLSDDIEVECEGKDKYKCGSNVFWKW